MTRLFVLGFVQVSKICFNILVDQILGDVNLSQGQLVMVFVVQDVHQVGVEWVDVLQKQIKHCENQTKVQIHSTGDFLR